MCMLIFMTGSEQLLLIKKVLKYFLILILLLQRSGVEFPQRSSSAAPIFTPPVTHATLGYPQPGYGMPNNSSRRLDEAMASEVDSLRFVIQLHYLLAPLSDSLLILLLIYFF